MGQGLDMDLRVLLILSLGDITLTKGQTDGTTEGTAGTTGTTDATTGGTGTSGTTDGTPTTGTFPSTTGESTTATAAVATTSATETFENTVQLNNQKVKVGKTTFKCNFNLVFSGDMVNLENSTMSCKGNYESWRRRYFWRGIQEHLYRSQKSRLQKPLWRLQWRVRRKNIQRLYNN